MENTNLYRHALPVIGNRGRGEVVLANEAEDILYFNYTWDGKDAGMVEVTDKNPNTGVVGMMDYLIYRGEGTERDDYDMIQHVPTDAHEDFVRGCIRAFVKGIEHTMGGN